MGIVFALRGDSLTARYSSFGSTAALLGNTATGIPTIVSDATSINGSTSINMVGTGLSFRGMRFPGYTNTPSGIARSILIRVKFSSFSATQGLFAMGGFHRNQVNYMGSSVTTTPEITGTLSNQIAQTSTGTSTSSGLTTAAWFDIVQTWTGDTTANGHKIYVNGTAKLTATSTRSLVTPYDDNERRGCWNVIIGPDSSNPNTHYMLDEFVVWDTVIDPTSITLTSGSGSLNGASRTAYVDVASYDGLAVSGNTSSYIGTGGITF